MAFFLKNKPRLTDRKNAISVANSSSPDVNKTSIAKKTFQSINKKGGNRYSLIIGDDGAILIYSEGAVVKSRNFIASTGQENLDYLKNILSQNSKAPLFLIVDSIDQSFVQQSLPPISSLGVKKLIKRRLDRDLGKDIIKGYILLEREESGRRDWNFLMVSLEKSKQLSIWLDFIEQIDNRLAGIYLLSVESEGIIKSLNKAMGIVRKKPKKGMPKTFSKWQVFITNNKVGGFRQVVLKDERIIFTRLGQPVGDATPAIIAGNIEQEMTSTIEYIKRLSFETQDGLDIYIIASEDINSHLDASRMQANNIYKFTPFEIADILGISGAAQPSDQFGDVILSTAISGNRKHRLQLSTPQAEKVNNLYNIIFYQRACTGLAVLGILVYGGMQGFNAWQEYSKLADLEQKKSSQQNRLNKVKEDTSKAGMEINKINETVSLYNQITKEKNFPFSIMKTLRAAIPPYVDIRDVKWGLAAGDIKTTAQAGSDQANANNEPITLILRFPAISNTEEKFSFLANKILDDLKTTMPDYVITYTKLPSIFDQKNEGGKIELDDRNKSVEIPPEQLEFTMSIIKNK